MNNIESLGWFLPELLLSGAILTILLISLTSHGTNRGGLFAYISISWLAIVLFSIFNLYPAPTRVLFLGMVVIDSFSVYFKILFVILTVIVILSSRASSEVNERRTGEYYALILSVLLGMMLLASAVDLLIIYVALELVSIPSYILSGYKREDTHSNEASLKYVIYGAFATGLMLYGMSLLYGLTGTTNIFAIRKVLASSLPAPITLYISLMFILAGFGYKIASVPFHFWCPDVYQGAPTPITGFLSVGPKASGFAILIRFLYLAMSDGPWTPFGHPMWNVDWPMIIAVLSAVTMTLGNLSALLQRSLKRLLAYSSIAHAGYLLMGVVVLSFEGIQAVLFYLLVYVFMNLGAFLVVIVVINRLGKEEMDTCKGLGWRSPALAVLMTIFLFSLTGLPPTGGFVGKFYLFAAVIKEEYYWLAVIGVINSVIALYYYARIIKAMFLEEALDDTRISIPAFPVVVLILLAIPTLLLGIYWAPVKNFVDLSFQMLLPLP
ncbi:MAG: NADH-quinone oxidoreductase subunit N [Candidatus Glassbacteria bacterium]